MLACQTNISCFVYNWCRFFKINAIFSQFVFYAMVIWMYELLNVQCKPEKKKCRGVTI